MSESRFTVLTVPTNETEMIDLLASRPPMWEYLLFAYYIRAGLQKTEVKWRDYMLGYTMRVGERIAREDVASAVSERISRVRPLIVNIERVISPRAQELAFGAPGEPGDADMIEHMAARLIRSYELLLDWADEFRSLRFHEETTLGDTGAEWVSQPLHAYRAFVADFVTQVEQMMHDLKAGRTEIELTFKITFEMQDGQTDRIIAEMERLAQES
jgi:hypothetical protein